MTIRDQIIEANKAYRLGRPIMADQSFDDLCEVYEKTVTPEEYAAFRDSLHEETGKVRHPFIMGSLDKMKAEEPVKLLSWIVSWVLPKNPVLSVSAKIDGISCRLHYETGRGGQGQTAPFLHRILRTITADIQKISTIEFGKPRGAMRQEMGVGC